MFFSVFKVFPVKITSVFEGEKKWKKWEKSGKIFMDSINIFPSEVEKYLWNTKSYEEKKMTSNLAQ